MILREILGIHRMRLAFGDGLMQYGVFAVTKLESHDGHGHHGQAAAATEVNTSEGQPGQEQSGGADAVSTPAEAGNAKAEL